MKWSNQKQLLESYTKDNILHYTNNRKSTIIKTTKKHKEQILENNIKIPQKT